MLVELRGASFGYGGRAVVRVEALGVPAGRAVGVFGPNGSGKTTLVRGVLGLIAPMGGTVDRAAGARVGYLPQRRALELHWPMSGEDAAGMATSARSMLGWLGPRRQRLREAMRQLEVESLAAAPFARLSGGQQQRLLLAGALADDPQLLVLDEPTDGLDVASRALLLATLRAQVERGRAVVLVSHEVRDLMEVCGEVAAVWPGGVGEPSGVTTVAPGELAERVVRG